MLENISELIPFLIPLVVIQFGLMIAALVHVLRHKTYRRGSRVLWVIVSFISIIGPVLYFTLGKGDE